MVNIEKRGDRIYVSFPVYSQTYVDWIKTIPGRRFEGGENKEWSIPLDSIQSLVNRFQWNLRPIGYIPELEIAKIPPLNIRPHEVPTEPVVPWEFKTEPYRHQIQGFNFGITRDAVLIADEQGLGKTHVTINIAECRGAFSGVERCLVVAKASLRYNWLQEISIHGRRSAVVIDGANREEKLACLERAVNDEIFFIISNYEQVRDYIDAFKEIPWDLVILDEAHRIKNHKAGVSQAINQLNPPFKIALTGTPVINRPEDVYNLLSWLGVEKRPFWRFKRQLCVHGGYKNREIVGYYPDEQRRLIEKLHTVMIRRKKTQVLQDMPPKIHRDVWVDLYPQQRKKYDELRDELRTIIGERKVSVQNGLDMMLRLKQIVGSLELLGGEPVSSKIDTLRDILDEIVDSGQKALVFTQFVAMYNILKRELASYGVVGISGSLSGQKRQEVVNTFQNDPETRVFVGVAQACREGLTLNAASNVIFIDLEWSPLYVEQAEDRAHRIGQRNTVIVTRLLARNTLDMKIIEMLKRKKDIFDSMVEGTLTTATYEDLMEMLAV